VTGRRWRISFAPPQGGRKGDLAHPPRLCAWAVRVSNRRWGVAHHLLALGSLIASSTASMLLYVPATRQSDPGAMSGAAGLRVAAPSL
jgi:hypothetical protein